MAANQTTASLPCRSARFSSDTCLRNPARGMRRAARRQKLGRQVCKPTRASVPNGGVGIRRDHMRRALLAVVTAAGLAIGTVMPTSALGLTQVTLNCDDGTTWTAVVDTDTLTGLVAAVQAMLDYPAGLTCTLIQAPVVTVGAVALAGSGNDPFIVGGGRWQVPSPCESPPHPLDLGEVAKVPGALSYEPIIWSPTHATTTALIFV